VSRKKRASADVRQQYSAPRAIVVGRHVIVGIGGDSLDVPGYLGIARARNR